MQLFQELNDTQNITIVLVTHEPDIATYAKRQVRFFDGQIVGDVVSQQVKAIAKCVVPHPGKDPRTAIRCAVERCVSPESMI